MRTGRRRPWIVAGGIALVLLVGARPARADDFQVEEGFKSLFNGRDLSGWRVGSEALDGKLKSADGRFAARDEAIVIQGGKPIEDLYTVRVFPEKRFVLRLEFRAASRANSGLYIRSKQLQVRDYATLGPYNALKHYKPGDWNAIEVTVEPDAEGKGGIARCTCNGETLEKALAVPATGGIGLQSEIGQIEYRRIRIKTEP